MKQTLRLHNVYEIR